MKFSLLFFPVADQVGPRKAFDLLNAATIFADRAGFEAVWIPERHLTSVGGVYSNPAIMAAGLATKTKKIRLRAGSVILPLHHPISVVEAWSMVDHLSNGRVDIAFASGWNPNDFVIAPDMYGQHRDEWIRRIALVSDLWAGRPTDFRDGTGETVSVTTYPRPLQSSLNIWLTITRKAESFRIAGRMGLNVLTMLSGANLPELKKNIEIYRHARKEAGHDPASGIVTLMLHTHVVPKGVDAREVVRKPLMDYLMRTARTHVNAGVLDSQSAVDDPEIKRMAEFSFERYFQNGALFGDVDQCLPIVETMADIGVNEIASMVDFGLPEAQVLDGLVHLSSLQEFCAEREPA